MITETLWVVWTQLKAGLQSGLQFLQQTLLEGDWIAALLCFLLLMACLFLVFAFLIKCWHWALSALPVISTHPLRWPSSRRFQVRIEGSPPYDFSWKYPYLISDGSRYRFDKHVVDSENRRKFRTYTGTTFEFVRRPKKKGKNDPE